MTTSLRASRFHFVSYQQLLVQWLSGSCKAPPPPVMCSPCGSHRKRPPVNNPIWLDKMICIIPGRGSGQDRVSYHLGGPLIHVRYLLHEVQVIVFELHTQVFSVYVPLTTFLPLTLIPPSPTFSKLNAERPGRKHQSHHVQQLSSSSRPLMLFHK